MRLPTAALPLAALLLLAWAAVAVPPGLTEWQARRAAREGAPYPVSAPFAAPQRAAPVPGLALAARAGDGFLPVRAASCALHLAAFPLLALLSPASAALFALSPGIARDATLAGAGLGWGIIFVILLIYKYYIYNYMAVRVPGAPPPDPRRGSRTPGPRDPVSDGKSGRGADGPSRGAGRSPAWRILALVVSTFILVLAALILLPAAPASRGDALAAAVALIFPAHGFAGSACLLALLVPALLALLGIRLSRRDRGGVPQLPAPLLVGALCAAPWGGAPPLLALALLLAAGWTVERLSRPAAAAALLLFALAACADVRATFARAEDARDGEFAVAARAILATDARLLVAKDWSAPLLSELTGLPAVPFPTLESTGEAELVRLDPALRAASTARVLAFVHHADDDGRGAATSDAMKERLETMFNLRWTGEMGLCKVYEGARIGPRPMHGGPEGR